MTPPVKEAAPAPPRKPTRRTVLKAGVAVAVGAAAGGTVAWYLARGRGSRPMDVNVFRGGAPGEKLWALWEKRGWVKEADHYVTSGRNTICHLCPNHCILTPGDRSHCRNKVNRDGVLYTMAYANPCAIQVDPVEKKPLFHFLPGSPTFSLATSGCVLRCLNCQNWDISQRGPEETKDPRGPELRLRPGREAISASELDRLSLFPADAVAMAKSLNCPSIAYTYSEPIAYFEYARDTAQAAREAGVRNILVTSGSIEPAAMRDLGRYIDGAHIDLKGFDEDVYRTLNSGRLGPILETLRVCKDIGIWVEVVNLVVPTYTDKPDVIRRMCDWLAEHMGPDCPVHFSRFVPMHKLTYLPPTPVDILLQARRIAQDAGMRYVYVGNVPGVEGIQDTHCPHCGKRVVHRSTYAVLDRRINAAGQCDFCGTPIPGVWS